MARSYRTQVLDATARLLPLAELRARDRGSPCRWGDYPLALVWLTQLLSPGTTLAERFADARGWLRMLAPTRRLGGTYQGFAKAVLRRCEALAPCWPPPSATACAATSASATASAGGGRWPSTGPGSTAPAAGPASGPSARPAGPSRPRNCC